MFLVAYTNSHPHYSDAVDELPQEPLLRLDDDWFLSELGHQSGTFRLCAICQSSIRSASLRASSTFSRGEPSTAARYAHSRTISGASMSWARRTKIGSSGAAFS